MLDWLQAAMIKVEKREGYDYEKNIYNYSNSFFYSFTGRLWYRIDYGSEDRRCS